MAATVPMLESPYTAALVAIAVTVVSMSIELPGHHQTHRRTRPDTSYLASCCCGHPSMLYCGDWVFLHIHFLLVPSVFSALLAASFSMQFMAILA
jgi:hypothetical protein